MNWLIIVSAFFTINAFVLLVIYLHSHINIWIKHVTLVCTIVLAISIAFMSVSIFGYPVKEYPPGKVKLVSYIINYPSPSDAKGNMLLWVIQDKNPRFIEATGKPRAYEIPFSFNTEKKLNGEAKKALDEGKTVMMEFDKDETVESDDVNGAGNSGGTQSSHSKEKGRKIRVPALDIRSAVSGHVK